MLLTDISSYAEVRAVLGVSGTELPDSVLSLSQYPLLVTLDLEEINTNLPTVYLSISALPEVSRSTQQQRLYDLCRLYASYSLAKTLLTSLSLFAVASLTDGRAEFTRVADPFSDTKAAVVSMFNTIRTKLSAAYLVLYPAEAVYAASTFDYTVASTLGTDPVTATA